MFTNVIKNKTLKKPIKNKIQNLKKLTKWQSIYNYIDDFISAFRLMRKKYPPPGAILKKNRY